MATNDAICYSITTSTTISYDPWPYWTNNITDSTATDTATTYGDAAWVRWVNDSTYTTAHQEPITITSRDFTWTTWSEARDTQHEIRKREIRERRKAEAIRAKARRLLFHVLSEDEQTEYRRYGSIRIRGQNAIYELGDGSDLITVLDKATEQPSHQICLHAPLRFPKHDRLAAAVLALRFDEDATVRRGNIQPPLTLERRRRIVARREYRSRAA